MKIEEVLNKEQLVKVIVVGVKLTQLKSDIEGLKSNLETQKMLLRVAEEDAKSIIASVVDDAFYDYMNNIKDED